MTDTVTLDVGTAVTIKRLTIKSERDRWSGRTAVVVEVSPRGQFLLALDDPKPGEYPRNVWFSGNDLEARE